MPSFAGATEWLNSEPLGPADLRGRVVLVNFLDIDVHQLARAPIGNRSLEAEQKRCPNPPAGGLGNRMLPLTLPPP